MNVPGKPLLSCSPLEKGFTVEAAKLVLANAKPPAKGFQPLLAGWVHEKVKNYASHVQIPNPVTHCFTEQEAKQLALMTECKERIKRKGSAGKEAVRGISLPDLNFNIIISRELPGQVQWRTRPARAERASHHPAQVSRRLAVRWNAFSPSPLIIVSHYNGIRLISNLGCLFPSPCLTPFPAKLFILKGGTVEAKRGQI